jgi:hypothetical protein
MTYERRNWIALAMVAAIGGYGLGNGHTTQTAVENVGQQLGQKAAQLHKLQTVDIPKLKAEAKCEHTRAQGAIASVQDEHPLPSNLTADCIHPPIK